MCEDLKALESEKDEASMKFNGTFSDGNMISISAFGAAHPAIPTAADEEIRVPHIDSSSTATRSSSAVIRFCILSGNGSIQAE